MSSDHEQVKRIVIIKGDMYGLSVRTLEKRGQVVEMMKVVEEWEAYKKTLPRELAVLAIEGYRKAYQNDYPS